MIEVVLTGRNSNASQLENGAFADYIAVKGDVQIKTPENVSDTAAATLGISIYTVVGSPLSRHSTMP